MAVVDAVCAKCGTALAFESLTSTEQVSDVLTQLSGDSHASIWPADRTGFKSAPDSALAESFVDLGTTSSILSRGATKDALATPGNDREAPQQRGRGEVLQQLFQMATEATHVEHPMCMDCVSDLVKEVEGEIQELKGEIEAYETAIQRLDDEEGSKQSSFTAAPGAEEEEAGAEDEGIERRASTSQAEDEELGELDEELLRLEEEEQREWEKLQQLQNALSSARDELLRLEELGSEIDDLELHYWTLHNQLHLEVQAHLESRDALLSRIEVADRQLERLQQVNVLDDIFHISNDGPFGTISGYRMGRVCTAKESESAVPWSEMNAAWGQCVLLLHTMSQACHLHFAFCTLVPMGSQSRIKYKDHVYNLYGPPSLMQKSSYDTAMVVFLGAINEFAQWARAQDEALNRNILLRLPYAIDPDRGTIMNRPIRRYSSMQASDKVWTKALKDMLVNLKWLQKWMVERTAMQANRCSAASSSQPSAQAVSAS